MLARRYLVISGFIRRSSGQAELALTLDPPMVSLIETAA
jgi:hypothetical protein